jgi:hypothetical protein
MLEAAIRQLSTRKLRLFLCACCRRVWPKISRYDHRRAVEVGERFADGEATDKEREEARTLAGKEIGNGAVACRYCVAESLRSAAWFGSHAACGTAVIAQPRASWAEAARPERAYQADLLRCIVGPLSGLPDIGDELLTPTVASLAQAAYEERLLPSGALEAARLAVLSDALEEAGCDDGEMLRHLRSSGVHTRGCWAVDLLTGRE